MITIPTIQQITNDVISDLETQLGATIDDDQRSFLRAFAVVYGGKLNLYYRNLVLVQRNLFADTCDLETLRRIGIIKIGRYEFPAVAGQYVVTVTGTIGGVIPAGQQWKSDDDARNPGILYQLDESYTLVSSPDTITLRAITAGLDGKLDNGDTLTPTSPIPLVNSGPSSASVSSESVQPLAGETEDAYRNVILNSYRLEAQGGAGSDYRIWSGDAQGVAQVYPYAATGQPSTINLYIEATLADSSDGKGTPTQEIIDDVEQVVNTDPDDTLPDNERGRRPLQVAVNYLPVTPLDVNITIVGSTNFSATEKQQVEDAITEYITTIRPFVPSADIGDPSDILDVNNIIGVITFTRPGGIFTSVTMTVDGSPVTTYQFTGGFIPFTNSVTFP